MKLLLTGAFNYNENQISRLKLLGYEIIFIQDERVFLQIDVTDIDAVVCNGLFLFNDISNFKKLKFIQLTSAGLDRIPHDFINKNEIKLVNANGVYSIPIAEWVLLKILEVFKKSKQFYKAQLKHTWKKQRDLLELTDKTVSIIGFGNVGTEIAKRIKAFGVNLIGVGRRKIESELIDECYTINDIDKVLRKSDIVILTLPLTEETHHLIDADRLANIKDKSVLVNVSRGGIINEAALIEALQAGKFLGVVLDVFEEEPLPVDNPLWEIEDVIITPHNSFISDKINERLFELIYQNLKQLISINKGD